MRRAISLLANAFLAAFALDAALTVADELVRIGLGSEALAGARGAAAGLALALAPPLAACLPFAPALPARAFLPPLVFLAWALLGALPLSLWTSGRALGLGLGTLQVGLAALSLALVRRRSRSGAWGVRAADLAGAPVRPRRALLWLLSAALILPAALGAYAALAIALTLERATAGFVRFDLRGIAASEREYRRGDRRVRLVGLMHVGEDAAYRELVRGFGDDALVLAEGVSDRDGLLREGLSYENVARPLGLVVQPPFEEAIEALADDEAGGGEGRRARVVRGDVDLRDFSEETLAFLREVSFVLSSPDLATGLSRAQELAERFDAAASERVLRDLVELRNAHLIRELEAALAEHATIIVPWGALHLPAVERALVGWGFRLGAERSHRLVRYATLASALAARSSPRGPDPP
jgi:hypothetical protein